MATQRKSQAPPPPPPMMRSLVAPEYCEPAGYEIREMPTPTIEDPDHILVRVHAAKIITGDTQVASGKLKMLAGKTRLPIKLGTQAAGVVVAVGPGVKALRPGDAVYGMAVAHPMDWAVTAGFCSEYALGRESLFLRKPAGVSFADAAALLGNVVTAVQSFDLAERLMREGGGDGSLRGKTVFVPGALSATGSVGVQLAKRVHGAARVIATASTPKIPLVADRLPPGTVDQVVDYLATPRLTDAVPAGTVDFVYNTQWGLTETFPLLRRGGGSAVVSIASLPPYSTLRKILKRPPGLVVRVAATLAQWWYRWKLRGTDAGYDFVSGNAGVRADLERAGELIADGKVKAVATVVPFDDINAVREACGRVYTGKGGLGSLVIEIVS